MSTTLTIELKELQFFAHHGLYPEERITGNEFKVDLSVVYEPLKETITHLDETINYATLFELVRDEMNRPEGLLETVVMKIAANIKTVFPQVKRINIAITKLHPPIATFAGSVGVNFQKEY